MRATASHEMGTGRPVNVFATSGLVTASPRADVPDRPTANADDYRPKSRQVIEAVAAGVARVIVSVAQRLRDGLERRRVVRELRLLGRSRLADIGIEPNDIERVIDDMIAVRRSRMAAGGRRPRPRSE